MALVYPLKNYEPGEYEGPVDTSADQLVAFGFYPQNSASPDLNVGIEREAGTGKLILKTASTNISLRIGGSEYAWLDTTGLLSANKLSAVNNLYSPNLDTASGVALTIGGVNATSLALGKAGVTVNAPGILQEAGSRVWTAATLTSANLPGGPYLPTAGGTLTGNVTVSSAADLLFGSGAGAKLDNSGDVWAIRAGGTTGVIYLDNSGNRYVYYDGTNYRMPSGDLQLSPGEGLDTIGAGALLLGANTATSVTIGKAGVTVNAPGTLQQAGVGVLTLAGGTMTGLLTLSGDPTADLHAVPRRWVQGRPAKDSARVATTVDLGVLLAATQTLTGPPASYVTNGTTTISTTSVTGVASASSIIKVGAAVTGTGIPASTTVAAVAGTTVTLSQAATASGTVSLTFTQTIAALAIDGVTLALSDRVLVKDQTASAQNGIYYLTTLGTAAVAWVLTRSDGGNAWTDLVSALVGVDEGTASQNTLWFCTINGGGTLGTTAVGWQLVSNPTLAAIGVAGNAASATKLVTARAINGVNFDGTAAISVNLNSSLTFNNGGAGAASGSTFNGGAALTVSHNTLGAVPVARQVIAGAGLTGGGALSADVTLNVVANADGSIVVAADSIQVGVLATDAQHGTRGGGTLHAAVIAAGAAGFMTGADKTKLDGIASGAQVNDTAAQILAKLITVDGAGSSLDADLLDGQQGSYYAPLASPSFTGKVGIGCTASDMLHASGAGDVALRLQSTTPTTGRTFTIASNGTGGFMVWDQTAGAGRLFIDGSGNVNALNQLYEASSRVWTWATLTNLNQLTNGPGYVTSVAGALGYTPVNKAGDTMTGALSVPTVTATAAGSALASEGWVTISSLGGGWANYGSGLAPAAYYKDSCGIVHLRGVIYGGTVNATIFQLPSGYRPQYQCTFACMANWAFGTLSVGTGGLVTFSSGSNASVFMDVVSFRADGS